MLPNFSVKAVTVKCLKVKDNGSPYISVTMEKYKKNLDAEKNFNEFLITDGDVEIELMLSSKGDRGGGTSCQQPSRRGA